MTSKPTLAYEKISDGARFREQVRFTFSVAIIATVFIVPTSSPLEILLSITLGASGVFAALFLIASAARVKYTEPGRLYEVFYIGDRFRMWAYDWSLHVFAVALLGLMSLFITGAVDSLPGVTLGEIGPWIVFSCSMLAVIIGVLFITKLLQSKQPKKENVLPKI